MLPITNGRHIFGCSLQERANGLAADLKRRYGVDLPGIMQMSTAPSLKARVNAGRWIVDCPTCNSAEYVWPDEPLFMCTNCWNQTEGNKWRKVDVPVQRETIERILRARPVPQSRNWTIETLAELRAENREHGDPEEVS